MLFKGLNEDGSSLPAGYGRWPLPIKCADGTWTPGEWLRPIEGRLEANRGLYCSMNGYCVSDDSWLLLYESIWSALFEVERRGALVRGTDSFGDIVRYVVGEARLLRRIETWNERVATMCV